MATGIEQKILLENSGFTVEVAVAENYDILSNTSNVTVGLRVKSAYVSGIQYLSGKLKLDGNLLVDMDSTVSTHHVPAFSCNTWCNVVRSSDAYTDSPWTLKKIAHNTDGSKSVKLELELRGYGEDNYLSFRVATTKTIPLTHIPRASTAGASDANIGAISTISVLRRSAAYRHSIAYKFGTLSGYVQADGSISSTEVKMTQTSIPFLLPESFYSQIPNSPTGTCVLTIRTYSGNNRIGEDQTARFTVTAAKSLCAPLVSAMVEDINARTLTLTGDSNILVRYVSNALCTITATAKNSAAIASKEIGGVEVSGNSLQLDGVKTGTVVFGCTDTRGYSASITVKKTLVPYIHLSMGVAAGRKDPTSGKAWLTVAGNWFHGNFGAEENTLSVKYAINGGSAATTEPVLDGNTYKAEVDLTGLDYQKSHTITVTVTDKLESVSKSVSVGKGIPVFDWGEEDFQFHVPVNLEDGCEILKNGAVAYAKVDAIGTNKVFNKLTDVGITTFPTTMKNIANAMPNNSTLMLDSRDIIAGGQYEISNLGIGNAGMYMFIRGNSNARLSLLHIYGATGATTSYMNFGCYAATTDKTTWILGERQNGTYPDCRYRIAADGNTEWINPPMLPGTEYRTTERWNGKVVYKKLLLWKITSDISGTARYEIPHSITNLDSASLRVVWTTEEWTLPYVNATESLYVSGVNAATNSTKLIVKSDGNASWGAGRTFYFHMSYCKSA